MVNKLLRLTTLCGVSIVTIAATTTPVFAGPVIAPIIGPLLFQIASFGVTALGLSAGVSLAIASALVNTAITIGLNYAAGALLGPKKQPQPTPEKFQSLLREPTSSRFRSYGLVKLSGILDYLTVKNGELFRVVICGQGEINAFKDFYIGSKKVEIDAAGWVTTAPWANKVRFLMRKGTDNQAAYSELIAAAPEDWTIAHRGNGMPHFLMIMKAVTNEEFAKLYPRGEPVPSVVAETSLVFDWRDPTQVRSNKLTWKYSSNAALILADYLTHPDGMNWPWWRIEYSLQKWTKAANQCDVLFQTYGGGFVPCYQICNSYYLASERRADVLARYLQACDGSLIPGTKGSYWLSVGAWEEPIITIDDNAITGYEIVPGDNITTAVNVIVPKFTSPAHGFITIDAPSLRNEEDIAVRGELPAPVDYLSSPNQNQTARLAKIALAKSNRKWNLSLTCNMRGLAVTGERFIKVKCSEIGIDDTFEITGNVEYILGQDMTLVGVRFSAGSINAEAYNFGPGEEGETLIPPDITSDDEAPTMMGLTAISIQQVVSGGQSGALADFQWTANTNQSLTPSLRYRKQTEDDTQWIPVGIQPLANKARSGYLEDGAAYVVQGRFSTATGIPGAWSGSVLFSAVADTVAPSLLNNVSISTAPNNVTMSYGTPSDVHYLKTRIYRSRTNTPSSATFVQDLYSPRNSVSAATISVEADGAYGSWYYWAAASNGSNIESSRVAAVPVTITVRGAQVISNGNFTTPANWVLGSNWSISTGLALKVAGVSSSILSQQIALVAGASYEVVFTVSGLIAGSVTARFATGTAVNGTTRTTNGTFIETLVAQPGNNTFEILATSTASLSLDDVSIVRIL